MLKIFVLIQEWKVENPSIIISGLLNVPCHYGLFIHASRVERAALHPSFRVADPDSSPFQANPDLKLNFLLLEMFSFMEKI